MLALVTATLAVTRQFMSVCMTCTVHICVFTYCVFYKRFVLGFVALRMVVFTASVAVTETAFVSP